jgi:hypothetical protein
MSDIKKSLTDKNNWLRGFFMLLFAVFYKIATIIICLIAIFQFALTIFGKKLNQNIIDFSSSLISYVYKLLLFVLFLSDEKPFPFAKWPTGHIIKKETATKKTPIKKDISK